MSLFPPSDEEVLADIARQLPQSTTPGPLRAELIAFDTAHRDSLDALRLQMLLAMADVINEHPGPDRHHAMRLASLEAVRAALLGALALKEEQAEPFEPARFALVAYSMAWGEAQIYAEPGSAGKTLSITETLASLLPRKAQAAE
jgi:hypothetical protein